MSEVDFITAGFIQLAAFWCFPKVLCCLLGAYFFIQCTFNYVCTLTLFRGTDRNLPGKPKGLHAFKADCSCRNCSTCWTMTR